MSLSYARKLAEGRSVWLPTVAVVGLTLGFVGTSFLSRYGPARKPMTIEYLVQDGSGAPKGDGGYTMYYRSDGASVLEGRRTSFPRGTLRPTRLISLPLDKTQMNFDPETNLVFTFGMGSTEIYGARGRRPAREDSLAACMSELVAQYGPGKDRSCAPEPERILGFKVWKTTARVSPAERAVVFETYFAPELDWRLLRQDSVEHGTLLGRIVAAKVTLGEPLDEKFHVPKTVRLAAVLEFGLAERAARGLDRCESCEEAARNNRNRVNTVSPVF